MRFLATVAVALACAACTAHNPDYTGGGGGGGSGGDLAGVTLDLAGVVLDLGGPMGSCTQGERTCTATVASDRCEGAMFLVDRTCPAHSSCGNGYCGQPTPVFGGQIGQRCDVNNGAQQLACMASRTAMLSCQPFVDPSTKNIRWFCDNGVGAGGASTACTSNAQCRSGVCADRSGICFDACTTNADCSLIGDGAFTCQSLPITVEGVTVTQKGCAP